MPYKPKRPCGWPSCPELTDGYYCAEHQRLADSRYNSKRGVDYRKRYDGDWPLVSRRFLLAHPFCEECSRFGKLTRATEVHHVLPVADGGTNDERNLMALCKSCHSRITMTAAQAKRTKR